MRESKYLGGVIKTVSRVYVTFKLPVTVCLMVRNRFKVKWLELEILRLRPMNNLSRYGFLFRLQFACRIFLLMLIQQISAISATVRR